MLVIHPNDKTTMMLRALYEGLDAKVVDDYRPTKNIAHLLYHTSQQERIMLLGHGCDKGLLCRKDETDDVFQHLIVFHPHAYYLRRHNGNIVAVWCHADEFARKEGLHGLFTGMIISELSEAQANDVQTTQEELDRENVKLAQRLRMLLDEGIPLCDIPERMLALEDVHSPLTTFNYRRFYYL